MLAEVLFDVCIEGDEVMNTRFSIGEMSKLFGISIKTLRYYDDIGLFKPAEVNPETGYRYYTYEQFEQLNTIGYLKYLGVSLKEIRNHLATRGLDNYYRLLMKERSIVSEKIAALERIALRLDSQMAELMEVKEMEDKGAPRIRTLEARRILKLAEPIRSNFELELALRKMQAYSTRALPLVSGRVGLTLSKEALKNGAFSHFNGIFIILEEGIDSELQSVIPEGDYVTIEYCGNDHKASPDYYKVLLDYIEKEDLEVTGDAIERVIINEYKADNPKDYLTELQIPVKKRA